jgi:hypothetical protein
VDVDERVVVGIPRDFDVDATGTAGVVRDRLREVRGQDADPVRDRAGAHDADPEKRRRRHGPTIAGRCFGRGSGR